MEDDVFHITNDDIDNSNYSSILATPNYFSAYEMESYFRSLSKEYKDSDDESSWKLCYFLHAIFSFRFSHAGDIIGFEPKLLLYSRRGSRPSDFDSEYKSILSHIKNKTDNPFVISRVCDVLWLNNRRDADTGHKAVCAYAQIINKVCDELTVDYRAIDSSLFDIIDTLERGLTLASMLSGKKKGFDNPIIDSARRLYDILFEKQLFNGFLRLSGLLYKYSIIDAVSLANNGMVMADIHYHSAYFEAVKKLLSFSAELFLRKNLNEQHKECLIKCAELTLIQYDKADSAMNKVHWLRTALGEYRSIGGMGDKISYIRSRLEIERELINDEMYVFSSPLDLSDVVKQVKEDYLDLKLSEIYKRMLIRFSVPDIGDLKEKAKRDAKEYAFLSMVGSDVLDEKGRLVAYRKPISSSDEISYEQACANYLRGCHIDHQIYIGGEFEVIRTDIMNKFSLNENSFDVITFQSLFVPPGHAEIFSLGFYRLWQGDYMSACYLLIPQLENSVRWVLESNKKETTKIDTQLFEEATSLSQILSNNRSYMEDVFGPRIVLLIDLLFNMKGGPSYRHDLAHGRMSINHCYSPSAVYACCFIFYLTCLPLFSNWDNLVSPHFDSQG